MLPCSYSQDNCHVSYKMLLLFRSSDCYPSRRLSFSPQFLFVLFKLDTCRCCPLNSVHGSRCGCCALVHLKKNTVHLNSDISSIKTCCWSADEELWFSFQFRGDLKTNVGGKNIWTHNFKPFAGWWTLLPGWQLWKLERSFMNHTHIFCASGFTSRHHSSLNKCAVHFLLNWASKLCMKG